MIVSIGLTTEEAINTYIKRSEMITIDQVERKIKANKKADFDSFILGLHYRKFVSKYENILGIKEQEWSKDYQDKVMYEFVNKYYKNGKITI